MNSLVTMWVGFRAATAGDTPVAKATFDVHIWPLVHQAKWRDRLVTSTDAADFVAKLNQEFQNKIKSWSADNNIQNADRVNNPFQPTQPWRLGSGGLHEIITDPITYFPTQVAPQKNWTFRYGLTGAEAHVFAAARWTDLAQMYTPMP